jgi:hypothetical protein
LAATIDNLAREGIARPRRPIDADGIEVGGHRQGRAGTVAREARDQVGASRRDGLQD